MLHLLLIMHYHYNLFGTEINSSFLKNGIMLLYLGWCCQFLTVTEFNSISRPCGWWNRYTTEKTLPDFHNSVAITPSCQQLRSSQQSHRYAMIPLVNHTNSIYVPVSSAELLGFGEKKAPERMITCQLQSCSLQV